MEKAKRQTTLNPGQLHILQIFKMSVNANVSMVKMVVKMEEARNKRTEIKEESKEQQLINC